MAELNSTALSALNAAVGARSEPVAGSAPNTSSENKGFAEMMAGAIQNQNKTAASQGIAARSQVAGDAKAAIVNQAQGSGAGQSRIQSAGQAGSQQMISTLQQQISSLQEKIQALNSQYPPLSDQAQAALSTLTQQLTSLKTQLEKGGGSTTLDGISLSKWMMQLDKVKTLLQQGDTNAASWTGQLQAMVQHLTDISQQTDGVEGRASQRLSSSHSVVVSDARQTTPAEPTVKETATTLTQGVVSGTKNNQSADNQTQFQNNQTASSGRNTAVLVSGQMQNLFGALGSALTSQTVNANSTVNSFSKGAPKPDLVMQLTDPTGDHAPGAFNLSTAGFGAAANTNPVVALPGALALNQPRMAADLGQNIQFMVGKNISRATLDVNPAHLGPMKITIDQQNNQTNIQIMASHHLAKDMLDQNMPRLREWLQDAGLGNALVTVTSSGQDGAGNQAMNQSGAQGFNSPNGRGASSAEGDAPSIALDGANAGDADNPAKVVSARWQLDTFA